VARTYSLCKGATSGSLAKAPVAAQSQPDRYAEKAIETVKMALQLQPALAQNGWLEPDFNPLYTIPEYRGLVARGAAQAAAR
jgi:hypothetical protein